MYICAMYNTYRLKLSPLYHAQATRNNKSIYVKGKLEFPHNSMYEAVPSLVVSY